MSETKYAGVTKGTVVRRSVDGPQEQGCGQSKRLYVGRRGDYVYTSFLKFDLDDAFWADVEKIGSAYVELTSDDTLGFMPDWPAEQPTVTLSLLTSTITEGDNVDGTFDASDYIEASFTPAGQVVKAMSKTIGGTTRINVTALVEALAPKTVRRRNGSPGGASTNYGFVLTSSGTGKNWAGWSEKAASPGDRPILELTYTAGKTRPYAPTGLSPSGSVPSATAFQGDFGDADPRRKLQAVEIEVYNSGATNSGQVVTGTSGVGRPSNHVHITEREAAHYWPDGRFDSARWEDCTWVSGVEMARVCHSTKIAATHKEAEALRAKAGLGPTGGGTLEQLKTGFSRRYGFDPGTIHGTFSAAWAELDAGHAGVFQGSYRNFPAGHKLRRWSPDFTDGHAVFVARMDDGDRVWWCDPLAPKNGSYQGEWVSKADLETYFNALAGFAVVAKMKGVSAGMVFEQSHRCTQTESEIGRFYVVPEDFVPVAGRTYKWRARTQSDIGKWSDWTNLVSFSVSNNVPDAPIPSPDGSVYDTLSGVVFSGGEFSDPDNDRLLAFQCQLSPYDEGDPHWADVDALKWDTGKRYVASGATSWSAGYGGEALEAGDYTWRCRVWDHKNGVSPWAYATLTLTADFEPQPGVIEPGVQIDPHAPWRLVFRAMHSNGKRGPGGIVAIIDDASAPGASIMFNSPGELHFTLLNDHPQIGVLEPKQTHYAVEFYHNDGWREAYAGLLWTFDATENDVVFYGVDYLALFDKVFDDRFDPDDPERSAAKGGSKYVNKTIREIVVDQLQRAIKLKNSPVGFLSLGTVATMNEPIKAIYSTMQPTLAFVSGLIDSHRQGGGKKTRIFVRKTSVGGYEVVVLDNPGTTRDNFRLRYGELVQGYRIVAFDEQWASVQHGIGRTRDGIRVLYETRNAPGIDQTIWGRIAQAAVFDGVTSETDLERRTKQSAIRAGKLGKKIGLALKAGALRPRDGYDIPDVIPVDIDYGAVRTQSWGSGYWVCYGIAWEGGSSGDQNLVLSLLPRDDTVAPDSDLIPGREISTQPEWQVGWEPPDPYATGAKYVLDQTTGRVYTKVEDPSSPVNITAVSAGSLISATAHGFSAGDAVKVGNLIGGDGLSDRTLYYVIADGLTADALKLSETSGGAAVSFTEPIDEGVIIRPSYYALTADGAVDDLIATNVRNPVFRTAVNGTLTVGTDDANLPDWAIETTGDLISVDIFDDAAYPGGKAVEALMNGGFGDTITLTSKKTSAHVGATYVGTAVLSVPTNRDDLGALATVILTGEIIFYDAVGAVITNAHGGNGYQVEQIKTEFSTPRVFRLEERTAPANARAMSVRIKVDPNTAADADVIFGGGLAQTSVMPSYDTFGTYTPSVSGLGTAIVTASGYYFRFGNMCFVNAQVVVGSAGAGGGTIDLSLPLAAHRGLDQSIPGYVAGMASKNGACFARLSSAGFDVYTDEIRGEPGSAISRSDFAGGGLIQLQGWYRLDDA